MKFYPSKEKFIEKSKEGNLIPVYCEILADCETPVSALQKLDSGQYAFLLESVEGGEKIGRYSFVGVEPSIIFKSKGQEVEVIYQTGAEIIRTKKNPLLILRDILDRYKPVMDSKLSPFFGGAVGYIGYDMVRFFEEIPDKNPDELNVPDSFFMITDSILIFDNVLNTIKIVCNAHITNSIENAYANAINKIELFLERLESPIIASFKETAITKEIPIQSNFKKENFESAVEKCKEYIKAGDIFQVVISQRFGCEVQSDGFDLYRALRYINPSPYMFYLKYGDLKIIGSSPELLIKVKENNIQLRPIAGTRRRGVNSTDDDELIKDLLSDEKEKAEHLMLVDLGRNDVGKVSEIGSVKVDEFMAIEKYSHVIHIVSNIVGKLDKQYDCFDALMSAFPAGTLTGAPKIRAMEIIDEIEPTKRGPYGGCVGYFSYDKNLDSCITIRTIVMIGKTAYIQAGAGIVADSVPEREFEETVNKAKGMFKAIELAEGALE